MSQMTRSRRRWGSRPSHHTRVHLLQPIAKGTAAVPLLKKIRVAAFLAVGLLLLAASPGQAHHVSGAAYSGTWEGGTVEFDVSADGKTVTRFKVSKDPGQGCLEAFGLQIPINDHAFDASTGPHLSISGSFPSARSAQGAFAFGSGPGVPNYDCGSGTVAWSATVDTTAPALRLGGSKSQSIKRGSVVVATECLGEACDATAKGTVRVPGAGRRFKLKQASAQDICCGKTPLKLGLSRKARSAIKRALRQSERVTAKVTVTARDSAGNAAVKRRTIRLTR
jgi:hypothetical protein